MLGRKLNAANLLTMRKAEIILSIIGAAVCLATSFWLWRAISAMQAEWPLPALYFLEMAVLGLIIVLINLGDIPFGGMVIWGIVGLFLGFVVLGVWSVGFIYLPVTLIFATTGVLNVRRRRQNITLPLGICLVASLAQIGLMLLVIR